MAEIANPAAATPIPEEMKLRSLNTLIGMRALSPARRSTTANTARKLMPTAIAMIGPVVLPVAAVACCAPATRKVIPAADSVAPGRSSGPAVRLFLGRTAALRIRTTTVSTAVTTKMDRQDDTARSNPPRTGPSSSARPDVAPQIPSAVPRPACVTVVVMIASGWGLMTPAPMPCIARPKISTGRLGAITARTLPSKNATTPAM
jgi:hypothetical protein